MHKPALAISQLRAIQDRNRDNPDVITLLREIKRLHGVLNNCWQVFDGLPASRPNSPLDHLMKLIDNEPSVKVQRAQYRQASGKE